MASFSVDRKDVRIVRPSKPTPSEVLHLSTLDNQLHLEFLCQTLFVYQANDGSSNRNPHDEPELRRDNEDPARLIEEALSEVLVYYYPLAGKLKRQGDGKLQITCNADGVPFLEATANCQLSSLNYLDEANVEITRQLIFDFPSESNHGYHPLVLQLTKFSCGGFTIGMGLTHSVCDGFGAAQFYKALAELASGKTEPSVKPIWERERLLATRELSQESIKFPVDKDSLANSPYLPTTDIAHECFLVSAQKIQRLKMSLMEEISKEEGLKENFNFTTVEVLGAYIWRSRFRALKLNSNGSTNNCFFLAVGIRSFLDPPLPEGYYGNAFVPAIVVIPGKDLTEGPPAKVAKLIKDSKKLASSRDYIRRWIEYSEKFRELNVKIEPSNGATMVLTDWRQLGMLNDEDFGWKDPVNMVPVPYARDWYADLCLLLPPSKLDDSMKGGVRVVVSLPRAAMAEFKEEMNGPCRLHSDRAV